MATAKKPATAAKRTTTRTRKAPVKETSKPETPVAAFVQNYPELTEDQRQAKVQAYAALKGANLPVPEDIATDVERWIAEENVRREEENKAYQAVQDAYAEENEKGPWYVRNLYPAPQGIRLDRQEQGKRRLELKPRGVPGDMHPLQEGDLDDPILRLNLSQGLIEVIPAGEAKSIIDKQMTNISAQGRVHPLHAMLRRPDGKEYEGSPVRVEAEFNSQGVTVGLQDPRYTAGQMTDKELRQTGGFQRVQPGQPQETISQFVPTGGNRAIISDGYAPALGAADAQSKVADDIARRRGDEAAAQYRQGLAVTVAPVQRT